MLSENKTLEYQGIEPDILVNLDRYSDLYGYEDKVLNTAFKLIDRSTK
jgi:C-terminal processing protease CtpA/Prc